MNTNILFFLTANNRPFSENAKEAGTVTLLGMVAIFSVLALLWGVIEILHFAMNRNKQKATKPAAEKKPAPVKVVEAPKPEVTPAAEDDGALIAVIMAAISATMEAEGNSNGFRVVSFKRAQTAKRRRF